jgi:hypothetical protein
VGPGNVSANIGVEVICTSCYLKGNASVELITDQGFNFTAYTDQTIKATFETELVDMVCHTHRRQLSWRFADHVGEHDHPFLDYCATFRRDTYLVTVTLSDR